MKAESSNTKEDPLLNYEEDPRFVDLIILMSPQILLNLIVWLRVTLVNCNDTEYTEIKEMERELYVPGMERIVHFHYRLDELLHNELHECMCKKTLIYCQGPISYALLWNDTEFITMPKTRSNNFTCTFIIPDLHFGIIPIRELYTKYKTWCHMESICEFVGFKVGKNDKCYLKLGLSYRFDEKNIVVLCDCKKQDNVPVYSYPSTDSSKNKEEETVSNEDIVHIIIAFIAVICFMLFLKYLTRFQQQRLQINNVFMEIAWSPLRH